MDISVDIYSLLEKLIKLSLKYFKSGPPKFSQYFKFFGDVEDMDYLIYQLGLRPLIPIVDFLYLEYIKFLLRNRTNIKKVFIFPTPDLSWDEQDYKAYNTFNNNLSRIFKEKKIKDKLQIEFLPLFSELKNDIPADYFFEKELLFIIQYTSSRKFIDYINSITKLRIRSFCDFNKFHPSELSLVSIYVHLIRNLWIKRFLETHNILVKGTKVNLGFLIWEWEIDKLGIYSYLATKYEELKITPILGKTIFASKNKPLPVFTHSDTVYIFENIIKTAEKLQFKKEKEIKNMIKLLKLILISNYRKNYENLELESKLRRSKEINQWYNGYILSFPQLQRFSLSLTKHKCLFLLYHLKNILEYDFNNKTYS